MFRFRGIFRAAAFSLAAIVAAGVARAETLTEALVSAYNTNPQLAAVRASLRVTDEDLAEALSGFRPTINAQWAAGRTRSTLTRARPQYLNPMNRQVQIVLPLFPLSGFAAVNSADARIEVGRANLAAVEQQVFVSVVGVYLDVIRDEALLVITRDIAASLTRELDSNKRRFTEGDISQTDIALTQTRLSQVQAEHVTAEQSLRRSRSAYEEVVGHPPLGLVDPGLPPALPETKEAATALATEGNPNLLQARRTEDLARVDIDRAAAGFAPSLSVVGSNTFAENESFDQQQEDQYSLQLQLRVPLYEGGATQSRVRRAKELWSQRRAETITTERATVRQVADAFDALVTTKDIIKYSQEGVDAARSALDGVRKEAVEGFRTTFDILQSEQNLLDAQRRLKIAERNELFAGWQLLAAIGAFNAQDTGLETKIYDPEPHADEVWGVGGAFSIEPLDGDPVPQPTSTAPGVLIPAEAGRAALPSAPAAAAEPAAPDFWDELFASPAEEAPAAQPAAAPVTPAPIEPASEAEGSFWTDVLGIPADEVQPP
jgi:TolC family type I secretion outer membrane protein